MWSNNILLCAWKKLHSLYSDIASINRTNNNKMVRAKANVRGKNFRVARKQIAPASWDTLSNKWNQNWYYFYFLHTILTTTKKGSQVLFNWMTNCIHDCVAIDSNGWIKIEWCEQFIKNTAEQKKTQQRYLNTITYRA